MSYQIALQLYTLRQQMKEDFLGTMRRIAEIGYSAVETAGLPENMPLSTVAKVFQDLEFHVCSAHLPLPLGHNKYQVIDQAGALGCQRILNASLGAADYSGIDKIRETCDLLNEANLVAQENGLQLGIHNHWWEFQPVEGIYPFEAWLEHLEEGIFFELDVYWVQSAGFDPAKIVSDFAARAPLLHLKDGPAGADTEATMTALGKGKVNIPAILDASDGQAEWLIVELDRFDGDMMTAVEDSFHYLKELV